MKDRDAKALDRWCYKHERQHERVTFACGAKSTMCPVCAQEPEFAEAISELVKAATKWAEAGFPNPDL